MTDVDTTPRRPRGRPRKVVVEDHQPQVVDPTTVVDAELQRLRDENAAMQNQIAAQSAMMAKLAARLGIDPLEGLETPPKDDTLVIEPVTVMEEPVPSSKPKPGSLVGDPTDRNVGWVPWRRDDLDTSDTVTFVPQPIPSLVFPMVDEDGRQKILLDVNDLKCWLTVGVQNTVNRFFYNAYMNAYTTWRDLEQFKRHGPEYAPWGSRDPSGRPAWYYEPMATSFGMDDDGHAVTRHRPSPLYNAQQENPEAI